MLGVVTPQYWPSCGPSAIYFHALIDGLRQANQRVRLFCSGSYSTKQDLCDESLTILRFGSRVDAAGSGLSRATKLLLFHFWAFYSVIKSKSLVFYWIIDGPLYWNLGAIIGAILSRAPFVYLVHDLYPDVLVKSGILKKGSLFAVLSRAECYPMRKAQAVFALTPTMAQVLQRRLGETGGKVGFLRFPVDSLFEEHLGRFDGGKFPTPPVLLYAGGIGIAHFLDPFVAWAKIANNLGDRTIFRLVANTRRKPELENNPTIDRLDPVPWKKLTDLYASCSAGYVGLPPGWGDASMPSKVFSILASGRPIVAVADRNSELYRLVKEQGVGIAFTPSEAGRQDGYYAVTSFLNSQDRLRESTRRARTLIRSWHSPKTIAESLLESVRKTGKYNRV